MINYPYNLHCHTLHSDGELLPSEVAVRYMAAGYRAIALTDHADYSNIDLAVKAILGFTRNWPGSFPLTVLPGIELTHLPPAQFKPLARYARAKGIKVIIAHGETVCEPVIRDTNRKALEADIDILAHPGRISLEDALLAKRKGVFLEITSRKGHAETNRYVVAVARKAGCRLILNNDSHAPEDIITPAQLAATGRKAGLSVREIDRMCRDANSFISERARKR